MRLSAGRIFVQNSGLCRVPRGVRQGICCLRFSHPSGITDSVWRACSGAVLSHLRMSTTNSMPTASQSTIEVDGGLIDLRSRPFAAFLAWLVPGAGHFYQGRRAKGTLYMVCLLSLWFAGFWIGGAHVVYASRHPGDHRWHYYAQLGAGLVALPALLQARHINRYDRLDRGFTVTDREYKPLWRGFMSPPRRPVSEENADEVSAWYARHGAGYEMGTWYTMIAGLLNILVIYDAFSGPLGIPISGRKGGRVGSDTDVPNLALRTPR